MKKFFSLLSLYVFYHYRKPKKNFCSSLFFLLFFSLFFYLFLTKKKMNNNNIEAEEVEIVNIGREGISYSELKLLHSLSTQTANNLSRILMTTTTTTSSSTSSSSTSSSSTSSSLTSSSSTSSSTTSSSTITPTLFSSKGVKISMTNRNFLIPFSSFKESCRACNYFGHSFKNCPNIRPEFRGDDFCLKCWNRGHQSINCEKDSRVVPYNEDFLTPGEIINYLMYK